MIARNEAERIGAALASVAGLAGEIVVVDTGSTDATAAIARKHGARVVEERWRDDFSAARNRALDEVSSEWVLMIDADERLGAGQEEVLSRLLGDRSGNEAWFVLIRSPLAGAQSGQVFVHALPRLFRNRENFRFRGRVHEQIEESIAGAGGRIGRSDLLLEHAGYALSGERRREKLLRNQTLLRADLRDDPERALAWYHLGETCALLDRPGEAFHAYRKAIEIDTLPPGHRAFAHQNGGAVLLKLRRYEESIEFASDALRIDRNALPALLIRASALMRLRSPGEALADLDCYLTTAARSGPTALLRFEPDIPRARFLRAECLFRLGRADESYEEAALAARERPGWPAPTRVLARAAIASNRLSEARRALQSLATLEPADSAVWRELARLELTLEGPDKALTLLERAIGSAPDASLHAMRGALFFQGGDLPAAVAAYARAIEIDPRTADYYRIMAHLLDRLGRKSEASRYLSQCRTIGRKCAESALSGR